MASTTPNTHEPNWQSITAERRAHLDALIPAEWKLDEGFKSSLPADGRLLQADPVRKSGILTEVELEITEKCSAGQLLLRLACGEVRSVDVTRAFCKRAAVAQQLTSCLTEHFFSRALERAQYLDDYLQREGKVVGPLHGLPISLKDTYCLEGIDTTAGYVSFLKNGPVKENSALVNLLLDLGAVLYVRTNIPQTLMTGDSDNNIYGRTLNPHNTALTAGGSTGGEGALIALRGSILGVGTDIAGSIRIPSLCCGLYGFKPTANRVPYGGQISGIPVGLPGIEPCAGPLAQSLDDIELFMTTVLNGETWKYDSTSISAPWNNNPDNSRSSLPPPPARPPWQYFTLSPPPDHISASGEPFVPSVAKRSSPLFTGPLPVPQDLDIFTKMAALHNVRQELTDSWRKTFTEYNLDVVLAPGAQNTAVEHDTYGWPPYTALWNLVDYPAIIVPYGNASAELDPEPMVMTDGVQPNYNPEAVNGMPCALQIVAPRFQDEKCLAAAKVIDRDIRA
ncbi:general amidase GmdB [Aspergillus lucknowensis]|uniref:Amidase signature domain-containing protein n=1 Tax=Aspergillus lucknowensis TaxID=176173 RepID=A0ABR4LRC4_9EURO